MVKSVMLKFARQDKHVTQQQVADAVGLSIRKISKLELDRDEWHDLDNETRAKFNEFFKGAKGWEPLEMVSDDEATLDDEKTDAEQNVENRKSVIEHEHKNENSDDELIEDDDKILTLVEFAYEGLVESKTHDDFTANINMLKRILKKYDI